MRLADKHSLISIRTRMLAAVFGKRISDDLIRVFCDRLERFSAAAITRGFEVAEQELERWPTPKAMAAICSRFMPSETWKYNFKQSVDDDGVRCLIDPETGKKLYRPQHCEEGQQFLVSLKKLFVPGRRVG